MNEPSDQELRDILTSAKRVAIVGLSDNPERDSHEVGEFLSEHGFEIIPVNPTVDKVLGRRSYASVRDIPGEIDVVDVFRKPEAVVEIAEDAIAKGAKVLWMQLGVVNEEAAQMAEDAGLKVVMDHCMKREYKRLIGK